MRRRLLDRSTGGNALTSTLSALQAVGRVRRQPIGQDGESLFARRTTSASHPNAFAPFVVRMAESLSVTDDGKALTNRAPPRKKTERDNLRVEVVFCFWQCDKKNHGWREGPPVTVPC